MFKMPYFIVSASGADWCLSSDRMLRSRRQVLDGTARTRALLLAQPTRNLDAIRAAVVQQVIARFGDGQVSIPMPSRISVGTKPDR